MSPSPFVFLSGSPRSKGRNKKIVWVQAAKYRHSERRAARRGRQLRHIATYEEGAADSSLVSADLCPIIVPRPESLTQASQLTTLPCTKSLLTVVPDAINSGRGCTIKGSDHQTIQLEECQIETPIEPAAIAGLLKSDDPTEENLREGWVQGGRIPVPWDDSHTVALDSYKILS